MLYNLENIRNN